MDVVRDDLELNVDHGVVGRPECGIRHVFASTARKRIRAISIG
jgi:hypothetical protein